MRPTPTKAKTSPFNETANGLASVLGVAVAFLLAPQIYGFGAEWVGAYAASEYWPEARELAKLGYLGLLAFFLFFLTRLVMLSAFAGFGLWLGSTLLSRGRGGGT